LFFWCWEGKIGSLLGEHLGHWITSQTWIPSSFLVRNLSLVWRTIFPRERNQNRDSSLPMWMKKMISPFWSKLMRFFPERQRIPPSSQTAWCQTRRGLDNLSSGLWHFFMSLPPSFFSFVYYTLCFFFSQDPQQVWKGRRISVCKRWRRREKAFRHFSWPRRGNFPMISSSSHLTLPGQFFFLVWLSKSFYDSLTRSHALNSLDSKRLDSFFFFNKFYLRIGNLIIGKEKGTLQLFQEWPHRHPSLGSFVRVCVCVKQEFEYLPKPMLQLH
jgi:hypothetical protein